MTKLLSELYDEYRNDSITYPEYVEEKCSITKDCEHDCIDVCVGCDKFFHDIKCELDLLHNEELPETLTLNCGDTYCHSDCYDDCH